MTLLTPNDYYSLAYQLGEYARAITRIGWLTDPIEVERYKEKCRAEIAQAQAAFREHTHQDINTEDIEGEPEEDSEGREPGEEQEELKLSQSIALANLFYVTWGVPAKHYSKQTGRPSLNKNALAELLSYPETKVRKTARFILHHREASKTLGFLERLPLRAHYAWNVCAAATKRWTCNSLSGGGSIQQIKKPRKRKNEQGEEEEVPGLRNCFIADPGCVLVKADKSQLELRIVSCLAGEEALLDVFAQHGDVHQATADILGISRELSKTYRYATTYGANDVTVHQQLVVQFPDTTLAFVKEIMKRDKARFPKLEEYKQKEIASARAKGYTWLPISNLRIIHYFYQGKPSEIVNWRIQHTAADDVNLATLRVCKALEWPVEHLKAQIHDELVAQCPEARASRVASILSTEMNSTFTHGKYSVSLPVEVKVGPRWGQMTKWKG